MPAKPPATPAQATVDAAESLEVPDLCCSCCDKTLYRPKRAVEYVDCRRMEADRPDQREGIPVTQQNGQLGVKGCEPVWSN
jgi:hypothetical protein